MKFWQSRYNPQLKLSQQELRDISDEIIQNYTPYDPHHQPELVLMPVDPLNLYAYWNLAAIETDNAINETDRQFVLRVYSLPEQGEQDNDIKMSFDIIVSAYQNQQKVRLPMAATTYSAVIGEMKADGRFSALATANAIHVPRENPLAEESMGETENARQIASVPDYSATIEENIETMEGEEQGVFILRDFNEYGYDLKVYEQSLSPAVISQLFGHMEGMQHTSASNSINKNTSGRGCN